MAASSESDAPPLEVEKMNKVQKLAALFIVIGPEAASQVMKNLDEHELDAVSGEMAKFPMIPQQTQRDILKEFTEVAVEASTGILGGVGYTQSALEKSVGVFRATNIVGRVAPVRTPFAAMQQIIEMEPRQIQNLLKQEQPQTIALVMSYLGAAKSAQLLVLLRPEVREQVVERLATLAATPIEVVEKLVEVLNQRVGAKPTRALSRSTRTSARRFSSLSRNAMPSSVPASGRRCSLSKTSACSTCPACKRFFERSTCATSPCPLRPPATS
jgi:flagellar motor switch protein FliG